MQWGSDGDGLDTRTGEWGIHATRYCALSPREGCKQDEDCRKERNGDGDDGGCLSQVYERGSTLLL